MNLCEFVNKQALCKNVNVAACFTTQSHNNLLRDKNRSGKDQLPVCLLGESTLIYINITNLVFAQSSSVYRHLLLKITLHNELKNNYKQ